MPLYQISLDNASRLPWIAVPHRNPESTGAIGKMPNSSTWLRDPSPDEIAIRQNQTRDDLVPGKSFDDRSNADYCPLAKVSVDTRNSCTNYASQFEF